MNKGVYIIIFLVMCVISIVSVGMSVYLYTRQGNPTSGSNSKLNDDAAMLAVIGTAIVLPDEKPTIISVTDREKLQDQEFFKKALNGDKVVIYEGIRRIFLYRPSVQKIIDIAPLIFTKDEQATPSARAVSTPSPTIVPQLTPQATSSSMIGVEERGNFELER